MLKEGGDGDVVRCIAEGEAECNAGVELIVFASPLQRVN